MEILKISDYERRQDVAKKAGNKEKVKELGKIIEQLKKKLPCKCGSEEFFLAPIVHIRCNNCKTPL